MEADIRARAAADPTLLGGKSIEDHVAGLAKSPGRMVDNAREMARILGGKGLDVRFDLFAEEDHFSVLPSLLGRAVPFALRR